MPRADLVYSYLEIEDEMNVNDLDASLSWLSKRADWAVAIAEQLDVRNATVLQAFGANDWKIVYVKIPYSDSPFLFFHGAPERTHFVTLWSGGARTDEKASIRSWIAKNALGIPSNLADCFAWHVTEDRDL